MKSEVLHLRIDPPTRRLAERAANAAGLPLSSWSRQAIEQAAAAQDLLRDLPTAVATAVAEALAPALRQLNATAAQALPGELFLEAMRPITSQVAAIATKVGVKP